MDYSKELEHLKPSSHRVEDIRKDMAEHFTTGETQQRDSAGKDVTEDKTKTYSNQINEKPEGSQLERELEGMMKRRHEAHEDSFIRGVAGLEFPFAEEEADAE